MPNRIERSREKSGTDIHEISCILCKFAALEIYRKHADESTGNHWNNRAGETGICQGNVEVHAQLRNVREVQYSQGA